MGPRPRMSTPIRLRRTSIAIIVLAGVVAFFAVFAVWAQRQLLETGTWTETSTEVLEDERVQTALDDFLVQALFDNVDVAAQALRSPQVQELWSNANKRAHDTFLVIVEGGNETLSTEGGSVNLDLGRVIAQVAETAGIDLKGKIPPEQGRIVILESDQLGFVQDMVNLLRQLALALPFAALALFALAIY